MIFAFVIEITFVSIPFDFLVGVGGSQYYKSIFLDITDRMSDGVMEALTVKFIYHDRNYKSTYAELVGSDLKIINAPKQSPG